MEEPKSGRLLSLDALRGFDMFWIVGGEFIVHSIKDYTGWPFFVLLSSQLQHVEWNGFHFYDLIFPLFLFLSGVTIPYSLATQIDKGVPKSKICFKALRRALLLILFGIIYNGLGDWNLHHIRYASVLGHIGIAYFFAVLIFLNANFKQLFFWTTGILLGYFAIQMLIPIPGYGAGILTKEGSINGFFDRMFFPGSFYLGNYDPEGWLVKISATATALIGVITGSFIKSHTSNKSRNVVILFVAAIVLLVLSLLWNTFYPINKNLWTGSFALHTAGWSIFLLAVFYFLIDVSGFKSWSLFFVVIGMNSITIYLSTALINYSYTVNYIFGGFINWFDKSFQNVVSACMVVAVEWIIFFFLYKKKIFLKV